MGLPQGQAGGHSLVALRAEARGLVVLGAVDVGAVVERAVPTADGPAAALVHEVPVEAGVGPMLCAFVLHKEWALLCAEFLQVPAGTAPQLAGREQKVKSLVSQQEVGHQSPPRALFWGAGFMATLEEAQSKGWTSACGSLPMPRS